MQEITISCCLLKIAVSIYCTFPFDEQNSLKVVQKQQSLESAL